MMTRQKTGYSPEFVKEEIVAMRTKELSISQIGELLYCPKSIVKTSHNNLQERSNSKTLLILGRRWITSPRTYGRLVKES